MKKLITLLLALTLCFAVVLSAAAAEFVPSISYKDNPEVVGEPEIKDENGQDVEGVELTITPVSDALEKEEEDRTHYEDLLVEVYEQLTDGTMKIPFPDDDEKSYVIRDLIDISLVDEDDPTTDVEFNGKIVITFDLGIDPDVEVLVYVYVDGEWVRVTSVVNNGDGTITCIFDKLGPVAFCVENELIKPPSPTGDKTTRDITPLIIMMAVSSGALILLIVFRRKDRN